MQDPSSAGPGLGAFLAFFFLAVALWLLMRNMNARMRRMAYRERDRIAALEAQQQPAPDPGAAPSQPPASTEPSQPLRQNVTGPDESSQAP